MKQITAGQIAEAVNGKVAGNPEKVVCGVASLNEAAENQTSFVGNKRYLSQLPDSKAGVILVDKKLEKQLTDGRTYVLCENVDYSFSKVIAFFAPEPVTYAPGIHPSAVVADSANISAEVYIGANAVVDEKAEIGPGTVIGAGCFIGQEVKIGAQSQISPNVTIMHRCTIGNKVILHSGVVIGGDGFGFVPGPQGLVKVAQTGIVQIDDDVEIGANTTVDRARFGRTWIKSNVKIDNQVMVAHNVEVGESTILVAQSGIAGSAKLGRGVIIAAQAGINGHITLGDGAQVAGTSGVVKSLPAGSIAVGTPAESQRDFMTRRSLPKKYVKLSKKLKELEAEIENLKK